MHNVECINVGSPADLIYKLTQIFKPSTKNDKLIVSVAL